MSNEIVIEVTITHPKNDVKKKIRSGFTEELVKDLEAINAIDVAKEMSLIVANQIEKALKSYAKSPS